MATGVNKAILIGNLGNDPQVRYTEGGKAVCNFSIATTEVSGTGDTKKEYTEWHKIVTWDKLAEICGEYLHKGSQVYLEGSIRTRKWEKDGVDQYTTEINARTVQFLGPKNGATPKEEPASGNIKEEIKEEEIGIGDDFGFGDDDVPF